jgi:hypothetical protein
MEENPYKAPHGASSNAEPRRTGLLTKTNPRATWRSVIRHAIIGTVFTPLFFFVLGKPALREHWGFFLPIFALLGAAVAAICEWQLDHGPDEPADDDVA